MFNKDFYPTPAEVISTMLNGYDISNKIFLEPSAGKGDIVDYLLSNGAQSVMACESNKDLQAILKTKCSVIADDFLTLESHQISHINAIVMNPPFSADEKHIVHAYNIAPDGCTIFALCNAETYNRAHSRSREIFKQIVNDYGSFQNLGDCFSDAERKTGVNVGLVILNKPASNYDTEFSGFFMEEEPEEEHVNGLMQYNVVRDLVNRYVAAMKIFDKQIEQAISLNTVLSNYFSKDIALTLTADGAVQTRNEFKKSLQKSGWKYIFNKLNMEKYATNGLREDINKFVEQQSHIPFTMRNIYAMLETVVMTTGSRMDKAIVEVFDKITKHHHENRHFVEGWKTNSHYLINEKFIHDGVCYQDQRWYKGESKIQTSYQGFYLMEDLAKALCFLTGENYDNKMSLKDRIENEYHITFDGKFISSHRRYEDAQYSVNKLAEKHITGQITKVFSPIYGELFDWEWFQCRAYKKGTMHFTFKDKKIWALFNQRVAKIKGYPLFEGGIRKDKPEPKPKKSTAKKEATVLMTFDI